jgi:hypothetical protein
MANRVGPILRNIATSFSIFKENYSRVGNNYKQMQVYGNNAFGYGRGMKNKLDGEFFGITLNQSLVDRKKLLSTTWESITRDDRVSSIETVSDLMGINLTRDQYQKIAITFRIITNKYGKVGETSSSIGAFLGKFKKGSRPFRKIISQRNLTVPGGGGGRSGVRQEIP